MRLTRCLQLQLVPSSRGGMQAVQAGRLICKAACQQTPSQWLPFHTRLAAPRLHRLRPAGRVQLVSHNGPGGPAEGVAPKHPASVRRGAASFDRIALLAQLRGWHRSTRRQGSGRGA